ncbi:uncharacterized protein LOC141713943 [Apium graveolens]|uniref:uncharacterized protein LOC141713943 n=1 Tax=Apium graveolens TaxID=4045 RepID=UPI003D7A5929
MSFRYMLDLNFSASEEDILNHVNEEEGANNYQPFDLNSAPEDHVTEHNLGEKIMQHGERERTMNIPDLNQPLEIDSEREESPGGQTSKRKKELSNDERGRIYPALVERILDGRLPMGTIKEVSQLFSVSTRTISRIWMQGRHSLADANNKVDVNHRKTKNCGRKRIQIDREQFRNIPLSKRTTIRSTASAMEVSKSALHRSFQSGESIRHHTNPFKPMLKDSNKKTRVQFCLSMLDKDSGNDPKFVSMFNVIHIDEKWFYISKKCEKYYHLLEECDPQRTSRPRFDSEGNETFSGKIGIFPYITQEPARRNSVNRVAGTLETKAITYVGKNLSRSYLINKVLPAILEKWPFDDENITLVIQQDNARTHIDPNDEEFCLAVSKLGLNVQLRCQPPNSPDLNILDLGFFNAIQSLQWKEPAKTVNDLVSAVQKAYDMFPSKKANHIFLTLQQCMIEILKVRGSNSYKIPHMNKKSLEKNRKLPLQLQCNAKLIEDATNWLNAC